MQKQDLLHIHLAEYNALTNRQTYILSIQSVLLAGLITWLTAMIGFVNSKPNYFTWLVLVGAQMFGVVSATYTYSYYRIIYYLEFTLKPAIIEVVDSDRFWCYHQFVFRNQLKGFIAWQFIGSVGLCGAMLLKIIMRSDSISQEIGGLSLNIMMLTIYLNRLLRSFALSKKIRTRFAEIQNQCPS